MEGPYRDLGSGFARLTGSEGARRNPSALRFVEDALFELVRNARDAGATRVFVASTLRRRRYRVLTVVDDGAGIPESYGSLIFDPGVTSRHLEPVPDPTDPSVRPHGAGLSLYHLANAAIDARLVSTSSPTVFKAIFDTHTLPERALQSDSRTSRSNLLATLQPFATPDLSLYLGSQAEILATLIDNHIIQSPGTGRELEEAASRLGLDVSLRTAQRVWRGEIEPASAVSRPDGRESRSKPGGRGSVGEGPVLAMGEEEKRGIEDILRRAARASYLEIGEFRLQSRPGEVSVWARIYEPEDEYE